MYHAIDMAMALVIQESVTGTHLSYSSGMTRWSRGVMNRSPVKKKKPYRSQDLRILTEPPLIVLEAVLTRLLQEVSNGQCHGDCLGKFD